MRNTLLLCILAGFWLVAGVDAHRAGHQQFGSGHSHKKHKVCRPKSSGFPLSYPMHYTKPSISSSTTHIIPTSVLPSSSLKVAGSGTATPCPSSTNVIISSVATATETSCPFNTATKTISTILESNPPRPSQSLPSSGSPSSGSLSPVSIVSVAPSSSNPHLSQSSPSSVPKIGTSLLPTPSEAPSSSNPHLSQSSPSSAISKIGSTSTLLSTPSASASSGSISAYNSQSFSGVPTKSSLSRGAVSSSGFRTSYYPTGTRVP